MSEDLQSIIEHSTASMVKAVEHLEQELIKIRAGKANPVMLEGIHVDYYGCLLYTSPSPRD